MIDYVKAEVIARALLDLPDGATIELDDGILDVYDLDVYDKYGRLIGCIDLFDGSFYPRGK